MLLFSIAYAGEPSKPCRNIVDAEVVLMWKTKEDMVKREAELAAAEVRAPSPVAEDALVMARVSSKQIDRVDPSRYTVVVQGPDEAERARFVGEWSSPNLPDSREMWTNYFGDAVQGPVFPAKVYVVDRISTQRCVFFVEVNGDARIATLPAVP